MANSLLEQLPVIVANGRKEAGKIQRGVKNRHRMTLQTREVVLPARGQLAQGPSDDHPPGSALTLDKPWANRLIYGDNLLAMGALLAGDETTPSLRGRVDLIFFDLPFGGKANYRTGRITLPGGELKQKPTPIEQFADSGTWLDGMAFYLAMMTPRLILMRELLADTGSIYLHLEGHVGHYVKVLLDEVFGQGNFTSELICNRQTAHDGSSGLFPVAHDALLSFGKSAACHFQAHYRAQCEPHSEKPLNDSQRAEKLLERIIRASCPEKGLVADFTGGSGNTAAAAEKSGRRWITTDAAKPACMIMRKRLVDQGATPFLYQTVGDGPAKAATSAKAPLVPDCRIGDLSHIVLSLYGALPLPQDVNPECNLGQIAGIALDAHRSSKTLVLADSPNKLTDAATLAMAIAQRDRLMGGWEKVVVLGWNFEPSMGETITALNDPRLEVLVIPPDLMDRLKKKGRLDKLRGQLRFSSLQHLTIYPIERRTEGTQETLTVKLKNHVLLSPGAINLDDASRARLQAVIEREPLALIDYWAVDPDYNGKVFRSVWQDYRGNTASGQDELRVATQALVTTSAKAGPRKVCVRAVDVFGFEAEVVSTVANWTLPVEAASQRVAAGAPASDGQQSLSIQ